MLAQNTAQSLQDVPTVIANVTATPPTDWVVTIRLDNGVTLRIADGIFDADMISTVLNCISQTAQTRQAAIAALST